MSNQFATTNPEFTAVKPAFNPQTIKTRIEDSFTQAEDVADALIQCWTTAKNNPLRSNNTIENCNIILWGPGGYGKSEISEMFADYLYESGEITTTPFVLSFNRAMTEDKMFGGMDNKRFMDTGEMIFLLEKAFIEHEIVIFEEMLDAFPDVLIALKDVLTSGMVRNGVQQVAIKTKMIIGCTNRSEQEIISDNAVEALLQRFIFRTKVQWRDYKAVNYHDAAKSYYKFRQKGEASSDFIASVLSGIVFNMNHVRQKKIKGTQELRISPRTFNKVLSVIIKNATSTDLNNLLVSEDQSVLKSSVTNLFKPLINIGDFQIQGDTTDIYQQITAAFKEVLVTRQKALINKCEDIITEIASKITKSSKQELKAPQCKSLYVKMYTEAVLPLVNMTVEDSNSSVHSTVINKAIRACNNIIKTIQQRISNNSKGIFQDIQNFRSLPDSELSVVKFNSIIKPLSEKMLAHENEIKNQAQEGNENGE